LEDDILTNPAKPIRLYRHALSGHSHRVELLLSLLGLPYELIAVDMVRGAHKATSFVARNNPFGQVPVIEDGDIAIADSDAILVYLATRYDPTGQWWPRDPAAGARVQQWLSVAAGQLVPLKPEPLSMRAPLPTTDALFAQEVEQKVSNLLAGFSSAQYRPSIAPRCGLKLLNLLPAHRSSNPTCLREKIRTSM
jgi:glutathione S-transferase